MSQISRDRVLRAFRRGPATVLDAANDLQVDPAALSGMASQLCREGLLKPIGALVGRQRGPRARYLILALSEGGWAALMDLDEGLRPMPLPPADLDLPPVRIPDIWPSRCPWIGCRKLRVFKDGCVDHSRLGKVRPPAQNTRAV